MHTAGTLILDVPLITVGDIRRGPLDHATGGEKAALRSQLRTVIAEAEDGTGLPAFWVGSSMVIPAVDHVALSAAARNLLGLTDQHIDVSVTYAGTEGQAWTVAAGVAAPPPPENLIAMSDPRAVKERRKVMYLMNSTGAPPGAVGGVLLHATMPRSKATQLEIIDGLASQIAGLVVGEVWAHWATDRVLVMLHEKERREGTVIEELVRTYGNVGVGVYRVWRHEHDRWALTP